MIEKMLRFSYIPYSAIQKNNYPVNTKSQTGNRLTFFVVFFDLFFYQFRRGRSFSITICTLVCKFVKKYSARLLVCSPE